MQVTVEGNIVNIRFMLKDVDKAKVSSTYKTKVVGTASDKDFEYQGRQLRIQVQATVPVTEEEVKLAVEARAKEEADKAKAALRK